MSIAWRGRRACTCLRDWTAEVERRLGHSLHIYQASYSTGVSVSAGTHSGGGALDDSNYTNHELTIKRTTGGASWHRTPAQGFMHHSHTEIIGCPHLSSGAAFQVSEYKRGRNGLAGRGRDDGPQTKIISWPAYKAARAKAIKAAKAKAKVTQAQKAQTIKAQKAVEKRLAARVFVRVVNGKKTVLPGITAVRLSYLLQSRKTHNYSRHVWVVQEWLSLPRAGRVYKGARDGIWGPATQAAYNRFRRNIKWSGRQDGAPGLGSLQALAAKVHTLYPVKEK